MLDIDHLLSMPSAWPYGQLTLRNVATTIDDCNQTERLDREGRTADMQRKVLDQVVSTAHIVEPQRAANRLSFVRRTE